MQELQIFKNNEFGEIRTVTKNNEPWFIATDVCSALDISNTSQALTRLDDDEKNTIILNEGIGNPNKSIVSEYGLYNLILASRKKEAKKFKRWITHDVIPSIRKHGAYMSSEVIEKTLMDPDYLIQLATNLKEEKAKRALAEAQIERDKPKVLFADSCEVAENSILIGEFAKRLKQNGFDIGQNKLFEWLRQHDYLCKSGERKNLPTQYSMERGLFEIKTRVFSNPNGSVRTTSTTKITGRGQIYFTNKFLGV